ncbi:hypothetical protein SLE2022_025940 [Rubroshorea leprosula]
MCDSLSQWPNPLKVKAQAHYQTCIVRKPIFRYLPFDITPSIPAHSQFFLHSNCPIYSPLQIPKLKNKNPKAATASTTTTVNQGLSAASSATKIEDSRLRNSPSNMYMMQSPSPWMPWFSSTWWLLWNKGVRLIRSVLKPAAKSCG